MDKNEAKQILLAYRADLSELDNPEVKKALKMAEEDPELGAFLSREQAFDRAFTGKLKEIEAPAGLMERILANAPAEAAKEQKEASKIIWWKHPGTWSAAACFLALIALVAVFTQNNSGSSAQADLAVMNKFAQAAALHSPSIHQIDFQHNDIAAIGAYLAKNNSPHPIDLPYNMDQLLAMGCLTYTWQDNPVGVICLKGKKVFNLYVAKREALDIKRDQPSPFYKQFGKYSTALWTADDLIYVLTVEGKEEDLSPLL